MNRFQLPGLSYFIFCLLVIGCEKTQPEPVSGFPMDQETVKIGGDVCLINLSSQNQNTKSHTWTIGESHAFKRTQKVPTQATQIYKKTFFVCPAPGNPRLLLVGKIRVEVCRGMKEYNNHASPSNRSHEISQNPDFTIH